MSFLPEQHNFAIWKGATFRATITLYTDEGITLRDLSSHTAELIIRDEPGGTPLVSLTTENGGITLGGAQGTINLYISATASASITWVSAVYDLTVAAGSGGDTDALLYGGFSAQGI